MSSLKFPQNFDETRNVKMDDVLLVADESKAEDPDCVKKAKISSIINAAGSPIPQIEKIVAAIQKILYNKADKEQVDNIEAHLEESIDAVEAKVDTNTNKISKINTLDLPKKLEDAPKDTKQYARQDGTWKQVDGLTPDQKEKIEKVPTIEEDVNTLKTELPKKLNYDGYSQMARVGLADGLTPRGIAQDVTLTSRVIPSDVVEGNAVVQSIKGNSVIVEGEIINNMADGVKTTGRNLWNEEWELGGFSTSTGLPTSANTRIRSKMFISVSPNTIYYKRANNSPAIVVYMYGKDGNFLGYVGSEQTLFTTYADCYYINFATATNTIVENYNHNICINVSDPAFDGQYEPYKSSERLWKSTREKYFPNGLAKVGTIADEITSTKAIKRIDMRAYQSGDESNPEVVTDMTNTLYKLVTPEETEYDELNLSYHVTPNGLEEMIAEGNSAPLSMSVVYGIDAYNSIINNRSNIGNMNNLTTTSKADLVSAINELKARIDAIPVATSEE